MSRTSSSLMGGIIMTRQRRSKGTWLTISTVVAGMIVMAGTVSTAWALCETVQHGEFT